MVSLTSRARVEVVQREVGQAERDLQHALAIAADTGTCLGLPNILECFAQLGADAESHREAARLFGAAEALRQRTGEVRFKIFDADYELMLDELRNTMGSNDFEAAWAEGAGLLIDEVIAYAQRGRDERKRPSSGWAALTPTEQDVVRLVSEGLPNKDIATRCSSHRARWRPTSPTSTQSSGSLPVCNSHRRPQGTPSNLA